MWDKNRKKYLSRLAKIQPYLKNHKFVNTEDIVAVLSHLILSGDRICIEGDNQKQASYLASAMTQLDSSAINNLHMIQSAIILPEHLAVF